MSIDPSQCQTLPRTLLAQVAFLYMIDFPSDILSQILDYACTDSGVTACTIRQVSTTLRDEVEPYRFRNIAVSGECHLAIVHDQLTAWLFDEFGSPQPTRKVDHLRVSCNEQPSVTGTWYLPGMLPNLARWLQPAPGSSGISKFDTLLMQMTNLCAPHLLSFTVALTCDPNHGPHQWIAPVTYPTLGSLSIRFKSTEALFKPTADHKPTLPALRDLHIHCESHFLGPGPLAIVSNENTPIELVSFHGPADSYIYHYALARFNDSLAQNIISCHSLKLHLTPAPTLQMIFDGRSVLVEDLLRRLAEKDRTLIIL
jgi:hypothetical protein